MAFVLVLLLLGAAQSLRGPYYALLFYLWFAYFRPEMWVWSDTLVKYNLSFLIGVWTLAYVALSSREKIARSWPVALIAAFLVHSLISTLLSPHYDWSMRWWIGFAKVAVVGILIISLVNTLERFRLAVVVMALSLGFEGVKQGWYYLLVYPTEKNLNAVEILGDNNGVAVGMLMVSALLLTLLQTTQVKWQKCFWGFLILGSVFRSISTYSRGGLLSLGAMGIVYWSRSKHKIRTGLLMAFIVGGLLAVMPPSYWERMDTITADEGERDYSQEGRIFFWQVAIRMGNDHPLIGVGHSAFQAAYNRYDPSNGKFGRNRAVHSTWFGVLAEQGYVGLLMLVLILALAFRACGRVRNRTHERHEQLFAFAGGLQAALVTVAVGGSFLSYHYVEVLWHFMALAFALERVAAHELKEVVAPQKAAARPGMLLTVSPVTGRHAAAVSRR